MNDKALIEEDCLADLKSMHEKILYSIINKENKSL